jgi:hypothetical protein
MFRNSCRVLVLGLAGLAALAGCGQPSRPALVGKVTYNGAPVPGGNLYLYSMTASKSPASTVYIRPDGTFEADAPAPGQYKVAVSNDHLKTPGPRQLPADYAKSVADATAKQGSYVAFPGRYRDPAKSGLVITIIDGRNETNFELKQ